MSLFPVPDLCLPHVRALTPALLEERGRSLLLLDLDNTLSPYSEDSPPAPVLQWMAELKAAGIALFLLSNNKSGLRAERYARDCGIPFISRAGKPHPRGALAAMAQMGKTPGETALLGDQVYTDGLCAKRAGILSIVVRPLELKNPLFMLRYIAEQPFRALCKEKIR